MAEKAEDLHNMEAFPSDSRVSCSKKMKKKCENFLSISSKDSDSEEPKEPTQTESGTQNRRQNLLKRNPLVILMISAVNLNSINKKGGNAVPIIP
jgi:hypothetical protein